MAKQVKKSAVALGLAMAFGVAANAHAVVGVHFDPDGTGAAGTSVITAFDWDVGHVLYKNCFGLGGVGGAGCTISAQGTISSINGLPGIPPGVSYTFVLQKGAISSAPGAYDGSTVVSGQGITFNNSAADLGFFRIYVDKTGVAVDPFNGTGYDNVNAVPEAKIILEGTVKVKTFGLVNNSLDSELLDQFNGDSWGGLRTYATSGSPKFDIEVTSIDANYFKDPLTMFTVDFTPDAQHVDNSNSPFDSIDPSKSVAGTAFGAGDVGADGVNDIYCGPGKAAVCSAEFQGDGKTNFLTQVLPEPGMLALLGLGIIGLGASSRRWGRK